MSDKKQLPELDQSPIDVGCCGNSNGKIRGTTAPGIEIDPPKKPANQAEDEDQRTSESKAEPRHTGKTDSTINTQ